jgi:hypothetical protein
MIGSRWCRGGIEYVVYPIDISIRCFAGAASKPTERPTIFDGALSWLRRYFPASIRRKLDAHATTRAHVRLPSKFFELDLAAVLAIPGQTAVCSPRETIR